MNCPLCGFRHDDGSEKCSSCGVVFSKIFDRNIRESHYHNKSDFWWREPRGYKDPSSRYRKNWLFALLLIPGYAWYMLHANDKFTFDSFTTIALLLLLCSFGFVWLKISDKLDAKAILLTKSEIIRVKYGKNDSYEKWNYNQVRESMIIKDKEGYYLEIVKSDGACNRIGIPPNLEPNDLISQLSSHGMICKDYTQQSA